MKQDIQKIAILAGGTGGHIFPGITIAKLFKKMKWKVIWIGSNGGMERNIVPKYGIILETIEISGLKRRNFFQYFKKIFELPFAIIQSIRIVRRYRPDVAIGLGGYVSGPSGLASWICKVPIVVHEQNKVAGLTNRLLSKISSETLQAYPNTLHGARTVGNPIREDILSISKAKHRICKRVGRIRLLIIGGSQGSEIFNKSIPKVASKISDKILIFHQTGIGKKYFTIEMYKKLRIRRYCYKVTEFINDVASAYRWADILISRSGAMTVSEVDSIGLPTIFVPYQHADNQQLFNAEPLKESGLIKIIEQSKNLSEKLIEQIERWNRDEISKISQKFKSVLSVKYSKEMIVKNLIEVSKRNEI
ncbi:undecaprenyldiphospho-muramoylpentapeptide beta-N-acetylglucosaminyltransferase [Candidatus Riesia pediculischaeffi]|uniref:UDP-N-acetylglucosamine--N-acetylmuramyl-(pentapeptide) pyrophosphoryl-undecaprenol N-acetylglucosamine transferase n=1 Tax=Candidatus Riesia pediculischaeffi TaxID=428411 RepID=A0A1V0HK30_9ENTR|nr:undecaprenyldiphospho-muramoylpentapeptide beta-N-acetylglucosaminyltransferase [Candidatus Riesia pediculischaeffi]ARC53189.1 hypothetical protein AOQ87_00530 [Candidatus Riesia pediculischaeffi]